MRLSLSRSYKITGLRAPNTRIFPRMFLRQLPPPLRLHPLHLPPHLEIPPARAREALEVKLQTQITLNGSTKRSRSRRLPLHIHWRLIEVQLLHLIPPDPYHLNQRQPIFRCLSHFMHKLIQSLPARALLPRSFPLLVPVTLLVL
jgi:hypothetical protein